MSIIPNNFSLLIKSLLHTPLQNAPDTEVVSDGLIRYRYSDLESRLKTLASGLSSLGIGQNSVVAVMDWDTHRYFECFFAVPMLGATLHTVNIRLAPAQIAYTIDHAEDDVILVHKDFLPLMEDVMPMVTRDVKLILLTGNPTELVENSFEFVSSYDEMMAYPVDDFSFPEFDERTRATTFYTTGTTGEPKAVAFSHRQIVLHTMGLLAGLGAIETSNRLHTGDVYMPITPMFHVHAWGFPYAATLLGIKQVYPGRYRTENLLRLIVQQGVTFTHCVPTILRMLLAIPEVSKVDLSKLKMLIGGSALPHGLAKAAQAKGINVYTGYGMSETCPVLTISKIDPLDEASVEPRLKAGNAVPLVDLHTVGVGMTKVPRDGITTGEVVVRAPWLNTEYVKNPEATQALWEGGYLHTGDVGHINAVGTMTITDRIKDVIKSGGEWISSLAIESLVSTVDGVSEVAVIGIPHKQWGERPALLIVRHDEVEEDVIINSITTVVKEAVVAGELSKWAMPDQFRFVAEIAKTSVGKIDKKRLRADFV